MTLIIDNSKKENKTRAVKTKKNSTPSKDFESSSDNAITLNTLYINELKNLYSAESQLLRKFETLIQAVLTQDFKKFLTKNETETAEQLKRLETILKEMGQSQKGVKSELMENFLKELENVIHSIPSSDIKDAAIIATLQRIKHYEIACYGTARTFANQLQFLEASAMLSLSLAEENGTDQKLSSIAEGGFFTTGVNKKASKQQISID